MIDVWEKEATLSKWLLSRMSEWIEDNEAQGLPIQDHGSWEVVVVESGNRSWIIKCRERNRTSKFKWNCETHKDLMMNFRIGHGQCEGY
jgi:hypothetical protein